MRKSILVCLLAVLLSASVAFATGTQETGDKDETVILKMSDNLSDRTKGWGFVVEKINAEFKKKHPEVEFQTESYPDQPYQEKIKIYAAAGELPDVMKYWSFSTLLQPLVQAGHVAEISKSDFQQYDWLPGALESNEVDGKLYGIPVSADLWVIYYNQAIFEEQGLELPETFEDLGAVSEQLAAEGIIPMVTDGQDAWPLSITYDNVAERVSGDFTLVQAALDRKIKFTDPVFVEAARIFQDSLQSVIFPDNTLMTGYGPSRNLFGQQQAAMWLMGSWELGLASDPDFPAEFTRNVRAMKFPVLKDGKGQKDDLVAWYGGNYIINKNTEHLDLAKEYLHMYSELFPKIAWDEQAGFPAQSVAASSSDTQLAKDLLKIAADAVSTSGTAGLDLSTPAFKEDHQRLIQDLSAGLLTPEEFTKQLDAAAAKAAN